MTQVERPRLKSAYRGVVYGIDVLDHATGRLMRADYVGQTRQRGRGRENQHRDDQPWSDLIVGSPRVLWEGVCTDDELNEMERYFIQDVERRPRLNWKLNEDNPEQIPRWVLLEQRHQRDDEANRPRWQPPERRQRSSLLEWESAPPRPASVRAPVRRWRPWQKHMLGWTVGWLSATIAGWIALVWQFDFAVWWYPAAGSSAALPTLAFAVWLWLGCPITRRQRRRARRKLGWR